MTQIAEILADIKAEVLDEPTTSKLTMTAPPLLAMIDELDSLPEPASNSREDRRAWREVQLDKMGALIDALVAYYELEADYGLLVRIDLVAARDALLFEKWGWSLDGVGPLPGRMADRLADLVGAFEKALEPAADVDRLRAAISELDSLRESLDAFLYAKERAALEQANPIATEAS
jgi:hypothetical protein